MYATLATLLLRLSEAEAPCLLPGSLAAGHRGPAFDRLLAAVVLEQLAPVAAWPSCDSCECGMRQRAVIRRGDALLAECPRDPASDRALSEMDVELFEIHPRRLVLEATRDAATELTTQGLWRLPDLSDGTAVFLTLARRIVDDLATAAALRGYARRDRIALVAPRPAEAARRTFASASDIRLVEARHALTLEDDGRLGLNLEAFSDQEREGRLRVDLVGGTIGIDGADQSVSGQAFKLLRLLLEAWPAQSWTSSAAISDAFSGRPASDLVRELRDDLSCGRKNASEIRNWIQNRRSPPAYRLHLPPGDVSIIGNPR